jgi:hypothetical protein
MASRKKKQPEEGRAPNPNGHGQVDARMDKLSTSRKVRRREPGDGEGIDIGITPGAFQSYESILAKAKAKPDTRKRMEEHLRKGIEETMKPIIKLFEREGASEYQMKMLMDVGPNCMRTMLEFFEEKSQ